MAGSPIGCHALVWTGEFDAEGIKSSGRRTKEAGFDLVEFPLMDPDTFDSAAARRALDDAGTSSPRPASGCPSTPMSAVRIRTWWRPGRSCCGRRWTGPPRWARPGCAAFSTVRWRSTWRPCRPGAGPTASRRSATWPTRRRRSASGCRWRWSTVTNPTFSTPAGTRGSSSTKCERPEVSISPGHVHMNIEESDLFQPFLDARERLGYVHIGESHRGYLRHRIGRLRRRLPGPRPDRLPRAPSCSRRSPRPSVSPTLGNTLGIWRNLWNDSDHLAAARQPVHPRPSRRGPHHRVALSLSIVS